MHTAGYQQSSMHGKGAGKVARSCACTMRAEADSSATTAEVMAPQLDARTRTYSSAGAIIDALHELTHAV